MTQSRAERIQAGARVLAKRLMRQPKLETLAQRMIHAEDGTPWRVREARAHDVPGAQAPCCLIFDAGHVCRRLWRYPEQWSELGDASLLAIMEHPR